MTQRVEVNQPVECEIYIGAGERPTPEAHQSRTCAQCNRATWAHTSICMWCGHDRLSTGLRLLLAATALFLVVVNFPVHFWQR